jgi:predicted RNA-binding protein with TRAM domain
MKNRMATKEVTRNKENVPTGELYDIDIEDTADIPDGVFMVDDGRILPNEVAEFFNFT